MHGLVTGVAGFIGSSLAAELLKRGWRVDGIDAFAGPYARELKATNLAQLTTSEAFSFHGLDLASPALGELVRGSDALFHLAAIPGVRASWGSGFAAYAETNITGTQRVLEAARAAGVPRVVYASSSSIYGEAMRYPCRETDAPRPHSPYGVSKLSAEQLCRTYSDVFGLHTVSLRYFSVYGPRQRPDMGVHRLFEAARTGATFRLFGDGTQIRDMTYVDDVVDATIRAATAEVERGSVYNVAGGSEASLNELIDLVEEVSALQVQVQRGEAQAGDVKRTGGDTTRARRDLGWRPDTSLAAGLGKQFDWHQKVRPSRYAS